MAHSRAILFALLVAALIVGVVAAQAYLSASWWTANAGGTSAGGAYVLSGAAGQPDAGTAQAGSYGLIGGFYPLPVPTGTPTPTPTVTPTPTTPPGASQTPAWRSVVTLSSGNALSVERRWRWGDLGIGLLAVGLTLFALLRWLYALARDHLR